MYNIMTVTDTTEREAAKLQLDQSGEPSSIYRTYLLDGVQPELDIWIIVILYTTGEWKWKI